MKQFVIMFRQAPRQFTEADLKKRAEETRAWAQSVNAAGHKLDPRILGKESHWKEFAGADAIPPDATRPVTALLFLEARDFAQAVDIAESHPATRYDASIEVRPWAPPAL